MRLRVIAVDYDGTIATDGVLDPAVRQSIQQARKRGVLVVIVTGRILSELRHVAGDVDFVDGVVAENGAVVYLPNGHTTLLGHNGRPLDESAATLRELSEIVGRVSTQVVKAHLRRHDFSSWIANLSGDHELANAVRKLESEHSTTGTTEVFSEKLSAAIEQRYACDISMHGEKRK